jgi:hypothetical protein
MGTFIHRAVIATMPSALSHRDSERERAAAALAEFRAALPGDDWRALVVGPVVSVVNQFEWVIFLPDGSKEWWDTSDEGDGYREQFLAIFPEAVIAEWGDEEPRLREARDG